ncbi:hypothetical protein [Paractinoplanes abujensis]|uniref:Ribosomally synthesized peptide with SipW-like signal peptide n=1 Tax=Paractinoplanes abujensis TaxID=882441 RepID=A0A7W7G153_9ACTN|nr:hypothetical protein [Actinoplanes abujensis]MBB4692289.1 hypothetical protein [Actinoplanes abujensis]
MAVFAGLIAASAVVWQASYAGFTGVTSNPGNTLAAGTVSIADNDANSAMFTASNVAPGVAGVACIGVQYTGSLTPSAIKLYFTGAEESNAGGAYAPWVSLNDTTSVMDNNTTLRIEVSNTDLVSDPLNSCTPTGYGAYSDVTAATGMNTLIDTNKTFATGLPSNWGTVTPNRWRVFRFTYLLDPAVTDAAQGDGVKFNVVWEARS